MNALLLTQNAYREIKRRRQTAEAEANQRLDFLLQFEDFNTAYKQERTIEFDIASKRIKGQDVAELTKVLIDAKAKTEKAMQNHNATREDLLPRFSCKKCNDTGVTQGNRCDCVQKEILKLCYGERQVVFSGSFELNTDTNPSNIGVLNTAKKWCESFPDVKKTNYFICGHTGVGKTFLTDCIASALTKKGVEVVYVTAYELNAMFREDFSTFGDSALMDGLIDAKVLIVDDLGKEPLYKKISLESLYCLLNERQLKGRSTIVTTNLDLADILDKYGESILARLANKRNTYVLKLLGADKRLKASD